MSEKIDPRCTECGVAKEKRACNDPDGIGPDGCPSLGDEGVVAEAMRLYEDPETREFARHASLQEAECYTPTATGERRTLKCRLEEICEFAKRLGYRRLGVAFCTGLIHEAELLNAILKAHGFEVVSIACKAGCVPKEEIGVADEEKIRPGGFESMCNPIAQAGFLNKAGTEFNIMIGLCVGHDALFLRHSKAPTTVFAVKDRLLGHNPIAALYLSGSYYKRLLNPEL